MVSTLKVPNIQQKYIFSSHVCIKFRNGECLGENGGESPNDCRSKGHIGYHVKTVHEEDLSTVMCARKNAEISKTLEIYIYFY